MLKETSGLEKADCLSIDHIDLSLESLLQLESVFPPIDKCNEVHLRALVGLALKVKTRNN